MTGDSMREAMQQADLRQAGLWLFVPGVLAVLYAVLVLGASVRDAPLAGLCGLAFGFGGLIEGLAGRDA